MSRHAQSKAAPAAARSGDQDDICPVCKSSRYLNTSMRFLVNPECYHKMCESCVDRIFSHGPNKCPIAGCNKQLRKNRFRKQTFEDLQVEREVDIRKEVAAVFNKREEDFETLKDYNDYLNDVEDITFNLVNRIDVAESRRKLDAYREQNFQSIAANAALTSQEQQDYTALQAAEREQTRLRREAARREEEEERRARAEGRQDILNRIATGTGDAEKIMQESQRIQLKKRLDKKSAMERQRQLQAPADATNGSAGFVIKGLKAKQEKGPEKPHDPFGGLSFDRPEYYVLQDRYQWDWLDQFNTNSAYANGGYDLQEFQSRALCEAFSGLGVLVADEDTARNEAAQGPEFGKMLGTVAAVSAGTGAKDVKMVDPF